jgi:hypothetical protein
VQYQCIKVDKCFILILEYSEQLAYSKELLGTTMVMLTEVPHPELKTSWNQQTRFATNTLHLHFIHQFAVKLALAVHADALTPRQAEFPETL